MYAEVLVANVEEGEGVVLVGPELEVTESVVDAVVVVTGLLGLRGDLEELMDESHWKAGVQLVFGSVKVRVSLTWA